MDDTLSGQVEGALLSQNLKSPVRVWFYSEILSHEF